MIATVALSIFDMVKAIPARKSMTIAAVVLRIFGMTNLDSLKVLAKRT
jgi:molybdenum cofactor biosynthesis enzyme